MGSAASDENPGDRRVLPPYRRSEFILFETT